MWFFKAWWCPIMAMGRGRHHISLFSGVWGGILDQSGIVGKGMEGRKLTQLLGRFKGHGRLLLLYALLYFLFGLGMNALGIALGIARFTFWWQVFTCYVFYMVPISFLLRKYPFHVQYAYGLVATGILEFLGYTLNTSYAYPDNPIDRFFGIRNFSLAMALFFAFYFSLGNWAVGHLNRRLFRN
jgi:hypothetical protein